MVVLVADIFFEQYLNWNNGTHNPTILFVL